MSERGGAISGFGAGESWLMSGFVERHATLEVALEREEAVANLVSHYTQEMEGMGADFSELQTAEQIHGDGIAVAGAESSLAKGVMPNIHAGVDGLLTDEPGTVLGILVADCCAVYVADPVRRAIALLHSGKKGTEAGIVPKAIREMAERFGSRAADLRVALSPCIRPPLYEVDFAAAIRRQCAEAGMPAARIHDAGLCTGSDLRRFYSYRMEQGKTGRMLAILGIRAGK